eukprot:3919730-Pleurochrysis_carterae.AAC.1
MMPMCRGGILPPNGTSPMVDPSLAALIEQKRQAALQRRAAACAAQSQQRSVGQHASTPFDTAQFKQQYAGDQTLRSLENRPLSSSSGASARPLCPQPMPAAIPQMQVAPGGCPPHPNLAMPAPTARAPAPTARAHMVASDTRQPQRQRQLAGASSQPYAHHHVHAAAHAPPNGVQNVTPTVVHGATANGATAKVRQRCVCGGAARLL